MAIRRAAPFALVLLALAGCGSAADSWAEEQADRLTEAGVTYPPEQERTTVISMVAACVTAETSPELGRQIYADSTSANYDWITPEEAGRMFDLADAEFCESVPNEPLGENP